MTNSRRGARRILPAAPAAVTTSTSPSGAAAHGTPAGEAAPGTLEDKTAWLSTPAAVLRTPLASSDAIMINQHILMHISHETINEH